jgi:hypothetical protein
MTFAEGIELTTSPEEISAHLPIASDSQVERFAAQIRRMNALEEYLANFPEDREIGKIADDLRAIRGKHLNYRRSYKIAVIGVSGAGKSSLTNALLGGDYSPVKELGGAATGAALQFFFDDQKAGKAEVDYHTEASIRDLIKRYLLTLPELKNVELPASIEALAETLRQVDTSSSRKDALVGLVDDYIKHLHKTNHLPRREFNLNEEAHQKKDADQKKIFNNLILEDGPSDIPTNLVAVARRYVPVPAAGGKTELMTLPPNCCLVDLPGTGGKPMHEIVIREGVRDADAVVFITRPRQGRESDEKILDEVRQYVTMDALAASDRVFLVINQLDTVPDDHPLTNPHFQPFLETLIQMTLPRNSRRLPGSSGQPLYFALSAQLALFAQQAQLEGKLDNPKSYRALAAWSKEIMGWTTASLPDDMKKADHAAMFEASKVPDLVRQLNEFARATLIENQIRDASQALNRIYQNLLSLHQDKLDDLTGEHGSAYGAEQRERFYRQLQDHADEALRQFTLARLQEREQLAEKLETELSAIADQIDSWLIEQMPEIWREHYDSVNYYRLAEVLPMPKIAEVIGRIELMVLNKLGTSIPHLAEILAGAYVYGLEHEALATELRNLYYQHPLYDELLAWLRNRVDGEGVSLKEQLRRIGARIAAVELLDRDRSFIPRESLDNGDYLNQPMYKELEHITERYHREADTQTFAPFIQAVHDYYIPYVHERCVVPCLMFTNSRC